MTYRSYSSRETKLFGGNLAKKFAKREARIANRNGALIFALVGDLGSGKTTFTQGFLRGLGVKKRTVSPTFIIFRRLALPRSRAGLLRGRRDSRFANLYHVDAYRLKKPSDLKVLGFKEVFTDQRNIVLIEWADKLRSILPKNTIWLRFLHGKKDNMRSIILKSRNLLFGKSHD